MPLQTKPSVVLDLTSEESLSIAIYVPRIYMQIVLCIWRHFCYVRRMASAMAPTIKVYQHKLNKKEFKLAFKLWCACVRSFFLTQHPTWWWYSYFFLLCKSYSSCWDTWIKSAPHPKSKKRLSTHSLSLSLEYIYSLCKSYANFRFQLCCLLSYWIFQGFIKIIKFE